MAENNINSSNTGQSEVFNLKDFLNLCLSRWYWFLISVVLCLGAGAFYILKTPKVYTRTATLLIKETTNRRSATDLESVLGTNGLSQINSKLSNEIVALQSPDLMREVVKRLSLDFNYEGIGRFKNYVLYGSSLPLKVTLVDFNGPASFEVLPLGDSTYSISRLVYYLQAEKIKCKDSYTVAAGDTVQTAIGGLCINPVPSFTKEFNETVVVNHSTVDAATRRYNHALSASAVDMKNYSDILNLTISDQSTQRADDVLNTVISVYNENWVDDRNKMAISTSLFIDDRLETIEKELGNVDTDISSFKSKNVIPDVMAMSNMDMTQINETTKQIQELDNELYAARYVRTKLSDSSDLYNLIPASSSIANASISSQITQYNNMVLERNNLVSASSEQNPLVIDRDKALVSMRSAIITSIDNQIATLQAQIQNLQRIEQKATSRLADNPNQAKYLLSVERTQKVKEAIYLFLLQRREENELSQAFTAYNTRLITKPTGPAGPTSPKTSQIMLIALILGFCIPLAIIYLRETLNTKLRGRKDLEKVTMPFLGEIPQHYHEDVIKKVSRFRKPESKDAIVVKHGERNAVNEAFRVLRTNLEFMTRETPHQVIAVTSFNPGSGKTFVTMNLAVTLMIKGQKVLVIDGDLRHASSSSYVGTPKKGLADYLIGDEPNVEKFIVHPEGNEDLDVLPVGTIPPNPTELIGDKRFADMIERLRNRYDIIFIDCPPIDIVADTQIIESNVDRTIFIVRAGLLERSMVGELESTYKEGRLKSMSLVLNGSEPEGSRYGYRYGYGYGYRYGYHSHGYKSYDYYSSK